MKRFSLPRAGTLLLCLALLAGLLSGCALPASPQGLALSAMAAPLAAAVFPLSSGLPQVQADAGSGTLPCYYDSASGVCYYVCEDLCKASPTEYTYTLRAFSVRDGKIHTQTLATRTVFYSVSGQPYTSYRDFSGNPMTESDYIGYADRYFSQCTSVLLSPDGSLAARVSRRRRRPSLRRSLCLSQRRSPRPRRHPRQSRQATAGRPRRSPRILPTSRFPSAGPPGLSRTRSTPRSSPGRRSAPTGLSIPCRRRCLSIPASRSRPRPTTRSPCAMSPSA